MNIMFLVEIWDIFSWVITVGRMSCGTGDLIVYVHNIYRAWLIFAIFQAMCHQLIVFTWHILCDWLTVCVSYKVDVRLYKYVFCSFSI